MCSSWRYSFASPTAKGSVGLPNDQVAFVRRLIASEKPVIVACFGNPYLVSEVSRRLEDVACRVQ